MQVCTRRKASWHLARPQRALRCLAYSCPCKQQGQGRYRGWASQLEQDIYRGRAESSMYQFSQISRRFLKTRKCRKGSMDFLVIQHQSFVNPQLSLVFKIFMFPEMSNIPFLFTVWVRRECDHLPPGISGGAADPGQHDSLLEQHPRVLGVLAHGLIDERDGRNPPLQAAQTRINQQLPYQFNISLLA